MKSLLQLSLITACLTVSGCTGFYKDSVEPQKPVLTLQQATVCCDSLNELSYKRLPAKYEAILNLDAQDPVIELNGSKTYVEPLALPQHKNMLLQIDSLVSAYKLTAPDTAVFPVITLLDETFQPITTLDDLPFEFKKRILAPSRIRFIVTINEKYQDARYALIHTHESKFKLGLAKKKPYEIVQSGGFDSLLYGRPTNSRVKIHFIDQGIFSIMAYPLSPG